METGEGLKGVAWSEYWRVTAQRDELLAALKYSKEVQDFAKRVSTGKQDRQLAEMEKKLERMTQSALLGSIKGNSPSDIPQHKYVERNLSVPAITKAEQQ